MICSWERPGKCVTPRGQEDGDQGGISLGGNMLKVIDIWVPDRSSMEKTCFCYIGTGGLEH